MNAPTIGPKSDIGPELEPDQTRCDVCRHAVQTHDRVALRYCDATQQNALSRGCLCK